jgi:hypothetical protein
MHNSYYPDKWQIIKIKRPNKRTLYKVFATWVGGYLSSDAWRVNSGIVAVDEYDGSYGFIGNSGSCYFCDKDTYGITSYGKSILNDFILRATKHEIQIEVINEEDIEKVISEINNNGEQ